MYEPGDVIDGRYELGKRIGEGANGEVWSARHRRLDREVAIKLLKGADLPEVEVERFLREGRLLGTVRHPNIVTVHDCGGSGRKDSPLYIVMERLEGRTLQEHLAECLRAGELPSVDDVIRWGEQICDALEAMHAEQIVHRDIKPANVMVAESGRVVLLDFGLGRPLDETTLTQDAYARGTPAYMPPEQLDDSRKVVPASDLYALGCTLYQLATGKRPFDGHKWHLYVQHATQPPVAPATHRADLPPALNRLVLQLLEKDPARRPATAADVKAALSKASRSRTLADSGANPPARTPAARKATPPTGRPGLEAAGTCLIAGLGTFLLLSAVSGLSDGWAALGGTVAGLGGVVAAVAGRDGLDPNSENVLIRLVFATWLAILVACVWLLYARTDLSRWEAALAGAAASLWPVVLAAGSASVAKDVRTEAAAPAVFNGFLLGTLAAVLAAVGPGRPWWAVLLVGTALWGVGTYATVLVYSRTTRRPG